MIYIYIYIVYIVYPIYIICYTYKTTATIKKMFYFDVVDEVSLSLLLLLLSSFPVAAGINLSEFCWDSNCFQSSSSLALLL